MNMASFVGKMFYFYPSCNLYFTQNLPCLRIYSCPCDEMQTIWGKLAFGCDARLHRDDEQLCCRTECSASTGNKKKNVITCHCNRRCRFMVREKKHKSSQKYGVKEQQLEQNLLFVWCLLFHFCGKVSASLCLRVCVRLLRETSTDT